ncbi:FUSC family protein [Flaviflagellibacter deserti]|uniref:FUSC family protein n=1 Tax=Flaviflagellibacter deserti TaxID=2267266 RepID=A0ABV9Z105_9HYPH
MLGRREAIKRSLRYASKTLIGAAICWYGLKWAGISSPVWAEMIVSDPDIATAAELAKARAVNTAVGCLVGLIVLLAFGYNPPAALIGAALTVMVVVLIDRYPANWRLAPATVIIVVDAGRLAQTHAEEISYALLRMVEIAVGCTVALCLAAIYTRWLALGRKTGAGVEDHVAD